MDKHYDFKKIDDLREFLRGLLLGAPTSGKTIKDINEGIDNGIILGMRISSLLKEISKELDEKIASTPPGKSRNEMAKVRKLWETVLNVGLPTIDTLVDLFDGYEYVDLISEKNGDLIAESSFLFKIPTYKNIGALNAQIDSIKATLASSDYLQDNAYDFLHTSPLAAPLLEDKYRMFRLDNPDVRPEHREAFARYLDLIASQVDWDFEDAKERPHIANAFIRAFFVLCSEIDFTSKEHPMLNDPLGKVLLKHGIRWADALYAESKIDSSVSIEKIISAPLQENEYGLSIEESLSANVDFPRRSPTQGWLNIVALRPQLRGIGGTALEQIHEEELAAANIALRKEQKLIASKYETLWSNVLPKDDLNLQRETCPWVYLATLEATKRHANWCKLTNTPLAPPGRLLEPIVLALATTHKDLSPSEQEKRIYTDLSALGMGGSHYFPELIRLGLYEQIRKKLNVSDLLRETSAGVRVAHLVEEQEAKRLRVENPNRNTYLYRVNNVWYLGNLSGQLIREKNMGGVPLEVPAHISYYLEKKHVAAPEVVTAFSDTLGQIDETPKDRTEQSRDQSQTHKKSADLSPFIKSTAEKRNVEPLDFSAIISIDGIPVEQVDKFALAILESLRRRATGSAEELPSWTID